MSLFVPTRVLPAILLSLFVAFMLHDDGKGFGNSALPGIGGNGPWSSHNMQLLGRLTLTELGSGGGSNVLGNDCWGWTDPLTGKEYAICGLSNGTSFVDISNPANPKYLGRLPSQTGNSVWRGVKVFNNHAFVISDNNGSHGMQVFNLTHLRTVDPDNPQVFSNTAWYGGITKTHNIAINENTGFAYLVGSDQAAGGLHIVNINNPANPVLAGNYSADGYTHDVQVVNYNGPDPGYAGREIAFCSNEDTVTIVDVTDKNNMVMISRSPYSQHGYTHQGWLTDDHRFFYACDELDEVNSAGPTRTHIFDCLDLNNPVYRGHFLGTTNAIDHNLFVKDNRIYLGSYAAGLRVLQIGTDPSQLSEIANFDTYNTNTAVSFNGVWSVFPYYNSNVVLINDRQNGMFLVKLSPITIDYPASRPDVIHSGGQAEFQVQANAFVGSPQPGSGVLHVDRGNGFEAFPMNQISANLYQAAFPSTHCGSEVKYYVSALATDGSMVCSPANAPTGSWNAVSGYSSDLSFTDDFETDNGWSVSGNASDGQWNRGIPVGGGLRGDPLTDADGSGQCYLTDNEAGNSDVDGGSTILTSPLMNATGPEAQDASLSYYRWFTNDLGGGVNIDIFVVEISNNDGETWVNVETVGPTGNEISGGWIKKLFRIGDFVVPTNQIRVRFTASDSGDGTTIEAGVDGVEVRTINCLQTITPMSSKIRDGVVLSGALADVYTPNNVFWSFNPSPTANPRKQIVDLIVQSEVPGLDPTELRLKLESRIIGGPAANVLQRSYIYNFLTGKFELVDSRAASNIDNLIDIKVNGDPGRFVNAFGEIIAQVKWTSPTFAGTPFTWSVDVDQIVWVHSDAPPNSLDSASPSKTPVDSGKTIMTKPGSR